MLTLEERERIAYANGETEKAVLLAEAIDGLDDRIGEARHDGYNEGYDDGFKDGRVE